MTSSRKPGSTCGGRSRGKLLETTSRFRRHGLSSGRERHGGPVSACLSLSQLTTASSAIVFCLTCPDSR